MLPGRKGDSFGPYLRIIMGNANNVVTLGMIVKVLHIVQGLPTVFYTTNALVNPNHKGKIQIALHHIRPAIMVVDI